MKMSTINDKKEDILKIVGNLSEADLIAIHDKYVKPSQKHTMTIDDESKDITSITIQSANNDIVKTVDKTTEKYKLLL